MPAVFERCGYPSLLIDEAMVTSSLFSFDKSLERSSRIDLQIL